MLMDLIQTLILAIIQGVTEWLPVSSSGHLAIVQALFDLKPPVIFDVALHVGTLVVVLVTFRSDLVRILKALTELDFETEEGRLAVFIIVGNVPIALMGFFFREVFKSFFYKPLVIGVALLGNGFVLYVSRHGKNGRGINLSSALLIGIAQGIALIPGVSRSGVTISTGLLSGLKREKAFRFSFLLSIPAVMGALIGESQDLFSGEIDGLTMVFGMVVSVIVGYLSLKLLRRLLLQGSFHKFALYCWLLGAVIITARIIG
jgi:undecaprenyl-diphosphatase